MAMTKKTLITLLALMMPVVLYSTSFRITGYLPSYRLESSQRATGNAVFDLTGYIPGYEADRNGSSLYLPSSYSAGSIENWYGEIVSDIIYFSIKPGKDGSLDLSGIKERDLSRLNNMSKFFGTRIHIAVSGNSELFNPVVSSDEFRKSFIYNLYNFCRENNFTGVDYDWEFPKTDNEIADFSLLINDTVELFNQNNMTVSAAVSRFRPLSQEIYDKLNVINLMAYDFLGRHSTYESAVEAVEYMIIKYDIPPEKLNLGIPFYGRIYSGLDPQYWTKAMTYTKIRDTFSPYSGDDEAGGYYFNGIDTVRKKTGYARDNNLGGVMIWELGQDSFDEFSLLKAISGEFK